MDIGPTIFLSFLCALWVAAFAYLVWARKRLPTLKSVTVAAPERWPMLSIVIPACNEAAHLESALMTLVQQDYPFFEIIVVNDRSTDATGAIIDRLVARQPRLRAVHIKSLPDGWLGKVHALQRGVEIARGEWLLFTDADVYFAPGALRHALAFAMAQDADHLALIPRTLQNGVWLDAAVRAFGLIFLLATRAASVNQPKSRAFVGIGAFNLVKTATFRRTAGFEWLRLEPGDDVGLGLMIKKTGAISRLALAYDELTVRWYDSVPDMFKGLEKNLFGPGSDYHWWLVLPQVAAIWMVIAAPVAALAGGLLLGSLSLWIAGSAALAAHLVFALFYYYEGPAEIPSLLLLPAGLLLISLMMLRAAYQCLRHDGIDWRGTHYPLAQLRAGQRVRFFQMPFKK
jgi:hypothetical protein